MKTRRGFTLIELLVVIAVIGILAGIVLVSVRKAPDAAKDARIQASLTQVRDVAQMHYIDSNNSFADVCDTGVLNITDIEDFGPLHTDIVANNGGTSEICYSSSSAYCVKSVLKANPLEYFCVDSTGSTLKTATTTGLCTGVDTEAALTCAND